ncbi:PP2C family protein-serine/threonine phosphatase [Streptomyces sp. MI02-7b]|uniref:PP2C family protein-serine/threonine phosphatase n=1 Tax=Streptomyces sp. MI02-7b TaxID=462941 RepID=UPI0029B42B63|nr:PP2C family protein-serine/threonine phosphatase [Streptomyces sp. MI02-7b]MDX3070889.1 PP2C family protein-serine/threonine phosphatase [Streptomyces sp. MI02-7b]
MGRPDLWGPDSRADVPRYIRALPVLLLVLGGVTDYLTPAQYTGTAFYSVAPMLAALVLSLNGTMLVGLGAIAADLAIVARYRYLATLAAMSELLSVAVVTVVAVWINRVLYAREARLSSARSIAATVQRAVLPAPPARAGALRIAARYEAAEQEAGIGGDLYAVQDGPRGLRCVVGDVRGKGLDAVEAATMVLGMFRMAAGEEATLEAVAARMHRALCREVGRRGQADVLEWFATAVLAEFPRDAGEVLLVNLGHPAPLVLRAGAVRTTDPSRYAMPLGVGLERGPVVVDRVPFPAGSTLLLCTDGVTEARDTHGGLYDPVTRLAGVGFSGPAELLGVLVSDVHRHAGGPRDDDMAMLAVTSDG